MSTNVSTPVVPDDSGYFGEFGGMYVPETLFHPLEELLHEYERAKIDPAFIQELETLRRDYTGRPTPLYFVSPVAVKFSRPASARAADTGSGACPSNANPTDEAFASRLAAQSSSTAVTSRSVASASRTRTSEPVFSPWTRSPFNSSAQPISIAP